MGLKGSDSKWNQTYFDYDGFFKSWSKYSQRRSHAFGQTTDYVEYDMVTTTSKANQSQARKIETPLSSYQNGDLSQGGKALKDLLKFSMLNRDIKFDLVHSSLSFFSFEDRDLSYIIVNFSDLPWSTFDKANMQGIRILSSNLHGSSLQGAQLSRCTVERSDFSWSNFSNANLQNSVISKSNLAWCDLRGANLANCQMDEVDLSNSTIDSTTTLPFDEKTARKCGMLFDKEEDGLLRF